MKPWNVLKCVMNTASNIFSVWIIQVLLKRINWLSTFFRMSNLAHFFNYSCTGNLLIYKVYTEILDTRIYRKGMYPCCDIELGEELKYDYNVSV